MQLDVEFATFGPKDLTAITGLSPTMQRDWRRAGHLPARDAGWARFSLMDVCAVAVRKVLADAGLGPMFGKTLLDGPSGQALIASVLWWSLEAQDVGEWLVGAEPRLASEVRAFDEHDHFGMINAVTGLHPSDRLRVVTFNPITGLLASDTNADEEEVAMTFTLRLDVIGRQIASRADRSLIKVLGRRGHET